MFVKQRLESSVVSNQERAKRFRKVDYKWRRVQIVKKGVCSVYTMASTKRMKCCEEEFAQLKFW